MKARAILWLLLLPLAATLVVPIYGRAQPVLFGFPFFYWYQILWIPLSAGIVWAVYAVTRGQQT